MIELEELRTVLIDNFVQTFSIVVIVIPIIILVAFYYFKHSISFKLIISYIILGVYVNFISSITNFTKLVEPDMYLPSLILSIGGGLGILVGIIYYLGYKFIRPLNEIIAVNEAVSTGNLQNKTIDSNKDDEVGRLIMSNKKLSNFLTEIISSINDVSNKLTASSQELASSAEEMNASSEEISAITQTIAKASFDQKKMIYKSIEESNRLKKTFVENMHNISTTIDSINSLTNQVNILALNASIEAARAGEYGRGFAVVAANIQELAINTKGSLDLIEGTTEELQKSMYYSINNITETIDKVAKKSEETTINTEEASASTEEQTAGMEELTSSSQELADLATILKNKMNRFIL